MVQYKRKTLLSVVAALLVVLLVGCSLLTNPAGEQGEVRSKPDSQAEQGSTQGEELTPARETIPTKNPNTLTAYFLKSGLYTSNGREEDILMIPLERDISAGLTVEYLEELFREYEWMDFKINTVKVEDGVAKVNMGHVMVEGASDQNEVLFLNLTTTLLNNCEVDKVTYTLGGGEMVAYRSEEVDMQDERGIVPPQKVPFSAQGEYQMPTYHLPDISREEIAALRAGISYEEVIAKIGETVYPLNMKFFPADPKAERITNAIQNVTLMNMPQTDFEEISAAPADFILLAAVLNAPDIYWGVAGANYPDQAVYNQLVPITKIVNDNQCMLQEHVEHAAKKLFGEDVSLTHTGTGIRPWKYSEYAGVYTPPHMGGGGLNTILLDYTEEGDTVTATAVFFSEDFSEYPKGKTLEEYYQKDLERHSFTLKKQGESYLLTGHKLLGVPA